MAVCVHLLLLSGALPALPLRSGALTLHVVSEQPGVWVLTLAVAVPWRSADDSECSVFSLSSTAR